MYYLAGMTEWLIWLGIATILVGAAILITTSWAGLMLMVAGLLLIHRGITR